MYTYGYLFYLPITVLLIFLVVSHAIMKKRPYTYYLMAALAIVYVNKAIDIAIFPILIDNSNEVSRLFNMKLIVPLETLNVQQVVLNMLLTFPIGIGMQFVTNLTFKRRFILVVLASMSFELTQLMLIVIWNPINIIFDMSDIMFNVIGAVGGLSLIGLINFACKNVQVANKKNNVFAYCLGVCSNCANQKRSLDFDS